MKDISMILLLQTLYPIYFLYVRFKTCIYVRTTISIARRNEETTTIHFFVDVFVGKLLRFVSFFAGFIREFRSLEPKNVTRAIYEYISLDSVFVQTLLLYYVWLVGIGFMRPNANGSRTPTSHERLCVSLMSPTVPSVSPTTTWHL